MLLAHEPMPRHRGPGCGDLAPVWGDFGDFGVWALAAINDRGQQVAVNDRGQQVADKARYSSTEYPNLRVLPGRAASAYTHIPGMGL